MYLYLGLDSEVEASSEPTSVAASSGKKPPAVVRRLSTAATLHSRVATGHLGSRHASIICSRVDEPWMTTARSTKASGGGA